jgi:hypothetical protein
MASPMLGIKSQESKDNKSLITPTPLYPGRPHVGEASKLPRHPVQAQPNLRHLPEGPHRLLDLPRPSYLVPFVSARSSRVGTER